MTLKTPITHEEMLARGGYRYLTTPYRHGEQRMLENVVRDMERGGIDYVLVGFRMAGLYICSVARRGMRRLSGRECDMTGKVTE